MTSFLRFLAAFSTGVLIAGTAEAGPNVVASIKPVHSLVSAVMQDVAAPALIVARAASPHAFSMRPSDAAALQDADIVFWIGPELELFLAGPMASLAGGSQSVELGQIAGLSLLGLREGGAFEDPKDHEEQEGQDGHQDQGDQEDHASQAMNDQAIAHREADMHVWLDPLNARLMVARIADVLMATDPENATTYRSNAEQLTVQLNELVGEVAAQLQPVAGRPYVVFHDAYHYFENRFGVTAAGSITVSTEAIPGARRIAEIHEKLKSLDAACVFTEPQFAPTLVSVVIEGTNAKTGVLDPIGADIEDGPELYFRLIRNMAAAFETCLTP